MPELKLRGSAQITIIDLTDGRRVMALLNPNKPTSVIYDPDTNRYLPDYNREPMVITPQLLVEGRSEDLITSASSIRWAYQKNSFGSIIDITESDSTFKLGTGSVKTLSLIKNIFSIDQSIRIYCYITYNDPATKKSYLGMATMEINKLTNGSSGSDALIGSLSNDAKYLVVGDLKQTKFSNVTTIMSIYDGVVEVTGNWSFSKTESSGVKGTLVGNIYTLDSFTGEFGEVVITATRQGFAPISKTFSLAKIKHGEDGSSTSITTTSSVIKKSETGIYSPSILGVRALYTLGGSPPVPKPVCFRISESTSPEGNTYRQTYLSTNLEEAITYTPNPDISILKIEAFSDLDLSVKIDEEQIPVVTDGRDSIMPIITTPNGITARNSDKSLIANLDIYKGTNLVRGSFYQWYIMDPESEGDVNSGEGWRKLVDRVDKKIRGSTSSTLEIHPSQILGTDTFMVVSSFLGTPIKLTVDLNDLLDPHSVSLLGSSIFKNGEGTNTYTAKVYRGGDEIDSNLGTYELTYRWRLYSGDNVRVDSFSKTGKQISITRESISSTGYLTVEVLSPDGTTLGLDRLSLTDISDAIISGTKPSSTVEGQIWIDTSNGGNVLKVYKNGSWQIQELDVTKLDSGLAKTIETITETLGSIANDNKLTLSDRIIIATDLSRIIGYFPSTSTSLVDEVLPDSVALDLGQIGDFVTSRNSAKALGINENTPEMKAVTLAWDTLRDYLNVVGGNTIVPWDITEAKKNIVLDLNGDEFRAKWLAYYNAQLALQGVILAVPGPEGQSAVNAMLDNDSVVIPTDSEGLNGIYEAAYSNILVYLGTRNVTSEWKFTEEHSDGITLTLTGNRVEITNITTDTGWVDISATAEGYPKLTRRFTIVRQKEAVPGKEVEMKWLSVSTPALAKDPLGTYSPSTVELSSFSKTGTGAVYPYNAVFYIEESSNGVDFLEVYNNSGNAKATHVYSPSKNLKAIRISLREVDSSSTIDTQTITVVRDGKDGEDGYTPVKGVDYFDGVSSKLHIRYSNDGGLTFTDGSGYTPGIYIGIYYDTSDTDSDNPQDYTWSKLQGNDAKFYQLLVSGFVFKFSSKNEPEPANQIISLDSTYMGGPADVLPVIKVYGISDTGEKEPITPRTPGQLVPSDMGSYSTLEVEGTYMGITDRTYISKIKDGFVGANGVTSYLTNTNHTIVTDSYGNKGSYSGASTELKISSGNSDETSKWNIITSFESTEITGVQSGNRFTVSKIKADTALVTFTATRSGYPTITQIFTVNRLKAAEEVFTLVTDSSSGNIFNNNITTTLSARVFKGNTDITSKLPNESFKWERNSGDTVADKAWNVERANRKSIIINSSDVVGLTGIFDCIVEFNEQDY